MVVSGISSSAFVVLSVVLHGSPPSSRISHRCVVCVVVAAFSGSFLCDLDDAFLAFSASRRCSKLSQVGLVSCPLLPVVPFAPFAAALDTEIGTNSVPL